jgi:hypothetical protein
VCEPHPPPAWALTPDGASGHERGLDLFREPAPRHGPIGALLVATVFADRVYGAVVRAQLDEGLKLHEAQRAILRGEDGRRREKQRECECVCMYVCERERDRKRGDRVMDLILVPPLPPCVAPLLATSPDTSTLRLSPDPAAPQTLLRLLLRVLPLSRSSLAAAAAASAGAGASDRSPPLPATPGRLGQRLRPGMWWSSCLHHVERDC